jgi:hypothetical protein
MNIQVRGVPIVVNGVTRELVANVMGYDHIPQVGETLPYASPRSYPVEMIRVVGVDEYTNPPTVYAVKETDPVTAEELELAQAFISRYWYMAGTFNRPAVFLDTALSEWVFARFKPGSPGEAQALYTKAYKGLTALGHKVTKAEIDLGSTRTLGA